MHPEQPYHPHQPHHGPQPTPHHQSYPGQYPPQPPQQHQFQSPFQHEAPQYQHPQPVASAPTPPQLQPDTSTQPQAPVPVVKVLSPVGVEYVFMAFTLVVAAVGLISVLLALVNGGTDFAVLAMPAAALAISVPLFALLFLHLKGLELRNPALKLDPSKRRTTQFIQIVAYITSMLTLIGFVFSLFAKIGGTGNVSIGKAALNALCVLVVAGGILVYYWFDEHRAQR